MLEKSWPSTWIPVNHFHRPRTQWWKERLHLPEKKPWSPLQVHPTNISLIILQSDRWPFTRVIVYGEKGKTKILEIHFMWILTLNHYQEITNITYYCLWLGKKVWRKVINEIWAQIHLTVEPVVVSPLTEFIFGINLEDGNPSHVFLEF